MRRLGTLLIIASLLTTAATADAARPKLKRFNSCGALVDYAQRHLQGYEVGGPPGGFVPTPVARVPAPMPAPVDNASGDQPTMNTPPAAAPAPTSPAAGGAEGDGNDFSITNNQEAGVFEPDIVKTDGRVVYALSGNRLHVFDGRAAPPAKLGSLALSGDQFGFGGDQMLLYKGRLLITGPSPDGGTVLRLVDVTNPAQPVMLRTLEINGALLSMRRTEQTVRVVINAIPQFYAVPNRVEPDTAKAWVPTGTFKRVATGRTTTKRLVKCRAVRRPKAFTGLESLTVLTIDMTSGLDPVDTDAVMTSGETIYGSASNLYVATQRYRPGLQERVSGPVPEDAGTQIHRFSLDDATNTTYRGSGQVPGFLLNQFSLSEQGGVLRTATTETPAWFTDGGQESQSYVTTLAVKNDRMDRLGQVGGLGKGERIYAVRFLGDVGYVVTFRQVDPLYTVDLADPAAPRVRGELKIPGFSNYLHPIGDGKLIGVGQGPADDNTGEGVQLSLFDVSDLDNPTLQQRTTLVNGNSEAQYDHHAFLWWGPRALAVLPVSQYGTRGGDVVVSPGMPEPAPRPVPRSVVPAPEDYFNGAVAFTVRPEAIAEAGRVVHAQSTVRRSLVMGDRLITMSDTGIGVNAMDGFGDLGFTAF